MSALLPAAIVVIGLLALLVRVHRLDPFADYSMRAFLFPGFRVQRRIAWLAGSGGLAGLLILSLLAELLDVSLLRNVMITASIYLFLGQVRVLLQIRDLRFDQRNADPVLQALVLLVTWPVWKTPR